MRFLIISTLLIFTSCAHIAVAARELATQSNPQCKITQKEKDALLKLDYQAFDQTLPDGGWRKYANFGCLELSRDLLDAYTQEHLPSLQDWQNGILIWHSGQMSAMLGDYPRAIANMEQTYRKDEKPADKFLWNPYVEATIAFLKKDKPTLLSAQKKLTDANNPNDQPNLRIVNSFVRCFNSNYNEAYSGNCKAQPNPHMEDLVPL